MQVLQAGDHKFLLLELDPGPGGEHRQAGRIRDRIDDSQALSVLDLLAAGRQAPLLLFDAADPGNLGWFSRCQFYVDGKTGAVLQTPMSLANQKDRSGHMLPDSVRLQIAKELPASFRLPGKQPVNEQVVYNVLIQPAECAAEHRRGRVRRSGSSNRWPAAPRPSERATNARQRPIAAFSEPCR